MSDQPKVQKRNADLVDLLSTDFVKRNEPNYAWRAACSAVLALPALRAFWPMSSVDYAVASRARDIAGSSYDLTDNNTPLFGYDQLAPYVEFDGVNQMLTRADGGAANWADITGAENYVVAGQRGLTVGCWIYPEDDANSQRVFSKWTTAAGNRSWMLVLRGDLAGDSVRFYASDDGTNSDNASLSGYTTDQWQFVAGRFNDADAGEELAVWINDTKSTAATARASIFDGNGGVGIGASADGNNYYDGRVSLVFMCAAALSDSIMGALYQNQRKAFNV